MGEDARQRTPIDLGRRYRRTIRRSDDHVVVFAVVQLTDRTIKMIGLGWPGDLRDALIVRTVLVPANHAHPRPTELVPAVLARPAATDLEIRSSAIRPEEHEPAWRISA